MWASATKSSVLCSSIQNWPARCGSARALCCHSQDIPLRVLREPHTVSKQERGEERKFRKVLSKANLPSAFLDHHEWSM